MALARRFELAFLPGSLNTLYAISPIGGVVNTISLLSGDLKPITRDGLMVLGSIVVGIAIGPIFCGWLCPFGAFQELLFKFKATFKVSENIDKKLRGLRYISLLIVILLTLNERHLLLSTLDPTYSMFHIPLGYINLFGLALFVAISILSLSVERAWCRYICPYGSMLGILNKLKIFRIAKNEESCLACKRCDKVCPMGIDVESHKVVRSVSCISCMDCIEDQVCPRADTITLKSPFNNSSLKRGTVGILIIIWLSLVFTIPAYNSYSSLNDTEPSVPAQTQDKGMREEKENELAFEDYNLDNLVDGEYMGQAYGFKSDIRVRVTVKEGRIDRVDIISHDDTPAYAREPLERIPKAIVEAQSLEVDTVTGATLTADGIISAVKNALGKF